MTTLEPIGENKSVLRQTLTSGVYFFKLAGKVIYIGKSDCVLSRIYSADHCDKKWDEIEIHWMPKSQLVAYEKAQIFKHRPALNNISHMTKGGRKKHPKNNFK